MIAPDGTRRGAALRSPIEGAIRSPLITLRLLDTRLLRTFQTRGHAPQVEKAVTAYSRLGEHSYMWFALAAAGAVGHGGRRAVYLRALRTVAAAELVAAALKRLVRRRRPRLGQLPALVAVPSDLSYPSAHAATSFAAASVLAKALPPAPLYGAAVLMVGTRPYLGVHYPSDILAGMLLGTGLAKLVP